MSRSISRKDEQRLSVEEFRYPLISSFPVFSFLGTLLSLFGIRSFICKCRLPEPYCQAGADILRLSHSLTSLRTHSSLKKLPNTREACTKASSVDSRRIERRFQDRLECSSSFEASSCGWQRSSGADWFEAKASVDVPFTAGERPGQPL